MTRFTQITTATLLVVAIGAAGVWAIKERGAEVQGYRFASVDSGSVRSTVSATGALSAVQTVEVGTQVSGQIAELHADFNDRVKKGQLLARIDPSLLQQAVQDAEAGVARAEASLAQAEEEYQRTKSLHDEKIATETEYNSARTTLALAQNSLKSSKIGLDRAKQNLSYTNIYSPIDGVVIERDIDVGQTVAASLSAPKLFLIANDLSQMQILASVDETDIGSIKDGQDVEFTVQTFQNRKFKGKVEQVRLASTSSNNVVSYTVVVNVANKDGSLLPGMTATVTFITGEADNVLVVANTALRFRPPVKEGDSAAGRGMGGGQPGAGGPGAQGGPGGGPGGGGPGGFGGFGGGGAARSSSNGSAATGGRGTLYTMEGDSLVAHHVRTGISDGTRTVVMGESIKPGMQVVIGLAIPGVAGSSTASNPFQQQPAQQRGPRGVF